MDSPEQTCTCGATAPPNARFCPMCGRPFNETSPAVVDEESPDLREVLPSATLAIPPISFGNPDALRSGYLAALFAALLMQIPLVNLLCFVWYPAAGFFSVYSFRKRTGQKPKMGGGVRLGWITGVLTFTISLLLSAIGSLLPREDGGIGEAIRRQVEEMPSQDGVREQLLQLLENPAAIAVFVLLVVVVSFIATIGLTVAGGALGARVLDED
jgi:uncharacterized membrane protein (DUF485 family)